MGGRALRREQLAEAAAELMVESRDRRVWLLYGEMGAGKTTLIKVLCNLLGIESGMSSPTFSIVNEYLGNASKKIFHFDFYRLKNVSEAFDIGIEEYFDSGSYCFVEWPEKISPLCPPDAFEVRIKEMDKSTRVIEFKP